MRSIAQRLLIAAAAIGWSTMMSLAAWAGGPWDSEIGEAKDVQRTAADIARRLTERYPYSPAARYACTLEQTSSQLLCAIRDGASWGQVQSMLRLTDSVSRQLQSIVFADCHVRLDERVVDTLRDFDRRFARLERELQERLGKLYRNSCYPSQLPPRFPEPAYGPFPYMGGVPYRGVPLSGFRVPAPVPYAFHEEHSFHEDHFGNSQLSPQPWNNPWQEDLGVSPYPSSRDLPPGSSIGPIHYGSGRYPIPSANPSPVGRQILSTVLQELANRL